MQRELRRAWVEVDLGALVRNARTMARQAGVPLLPMVKADAYGLGAVPVAKALLDVSPWGFGVATVREARYLRESGIRSRLLAFSPLLEWDFADARAVSLIPILGDPQAIAAWIASGGGEWHLGIDTGMHRSGLPWSEIGRVVDLVRQCPPAGACTHFHSAERNDPSMARQEQRFREALAALPFVPVVRHVENSPALERRQDTSPWTIARPGVFLYGVGGDVGAVVSPEPVAHLRGRIVALRDVADGETVSYGASWRAVGVRRIATVSLGYADGYRRALGNRGTALVHGRRVPVAGVVTMDMTMLDVTDAPCAVGDVATLLGRDGDEVLDAGEVARTAEMSAYELLTGLGQRAAHVYVTS